MRRHLAVASLLAAALAFTAMPTVAQAAPATPSAPTIQSSQPAAAASTPDGNLYVWIDINRGGGSPCVWSGDSVDWGRCRNKGSSLENRGYDGEWPDVELFWDVNYGGAKICVWAGSYLPDMTQEYFGVGNPGFGQTLNDNVSSHRWNNCR